jgi:hypothetical protein
MALKYYKVSITFHYDRVQAESPTKAIQLLFDVEGFDKLKDAYSVSVEEVKDARFPQPVKY